MDKWVSVIGYEGLYSVSNDGHVVSVKRNKLLKQNKHRRVNGYYIVRLSKFGKAKQFLVHRLVATAFIPNPNNKPEVNHIDRNKLNNISDNLEWVTHQENIKHSTGIINRIASFYELFPHLRK